LVPAYVLTLREFFPVRMAVGSPDVVVVQRLRHGRRGMDGRRAV
jgi:hypothetical protein